MVLARAGGVGRPGARRPHQPCPADRGVLPCHSGAHRRRGSAVAYYHATREIARGPGVAQRGRDAGSALGNDPVSAVATIVDRVNTLVADRDGAELLTTIAGGMRLSDYLPTRVFELVVHTADLCTALDQPADPPPIAAALALRLAGDLVVADGRAADVLLALCGRRPLPAGFTVL